MCKQPDEDKTKERKKKQHTKFLVDEIYMTKIESTLNFTHSICASDSLYFDTFVQSTKEDDSEHLTFDRPDSHSIARAHTQTRTAGRMTTAGFVVTFAFDAEYFSRDFFFSKCRFSCYWSSINSFLQSRCSHTHTPSRTCAMRINCDGEFWLPHLRFNSSEFPQNRDSRSNAMREWDSNGLQARNLYRFRRHGQHFISLSVPSNICVQWINRTYVSPNVPIEKFNETRAVWSILNDEK